MRCAALLVIGLAAGTSCRDDKAAPDRAPAAPLRPADGAVFATRADATAIAVTGTDVVWVKATSTRSQSLLAAPQAGVRPRTLLSREASVSELHALPDAVVFVAAPTVVGPTPTAELVSLGIGARATVLASGSAPAVATDGEALVVADDKQITRRSGSGAPTVVAAQAGMVFDLTAGGGAVAWLALPVPTSKAVGPIVDALDAPNATLVTVAPGGAAVRAAAGLVVGKTELVVDATAAYYLVRGEHASALWKVALAGGAPVKLADIAGPTAGLSLAGGALYWFEGDDPPHTRFEHWVRIMKVPVAGGAPVAVVRDPLMQAIAGFGATDVYWSSSSCPPDEGACIRRAPR